jgi:hypothetical protein
LKKQVPDESNIANREIPLPEKDLSVTEMLKQMFKEVCKATEDKEVSLVKVLWC